MVVAPSQNGMTNNSFIPARILLIEDDADVSDSVAELLTRQGYHVRQCFDGRDGLTTAINQSFHLILLDKMLPQLDGLEVLQRLRKYRDTPVIMLTACGAEQDRIDGFTGGADDYLPKPFNMTELQLRIEALLRRSMAAAKPAQQSKTIEDNGLRLNTALEQLEVEDEPVELTPIEFALIKTFVTHKGEVLSKPYLYQLVLKKPFSRYDRGLDMHVSNLRAKLGKYSNIGRIVTFRGQGYCFQ